VEEKSPLKKVGEFFGRKIKNKTGGRDERDNCGIFGDLADGARHSHRGTATRVVLVCFAPHNWFIIGAVAAIGWKVLEAVLAIIGGLATVSGIWIGRFLAMTERHRYVCMALVFLAIFFGLCVSALFSAYYLFSRFGAP